jgi:hypothetical protein
VTDADSLRLLMEAGGVDLFVSGHHAAYYLGRLEELDVLFAGGVGGRRLLGHDGHARSTLSLLDLWFDSGELHVTTFDLADMSVLPLDALPAQVGDAVRATEAVPAQRTRAGRAPLPCAGCGMAPAASPPPGP